jgi:hypothetical protein
MRAYEVRGNSLDSVVAVEREHPKPLAGQVLLRIGILTGAHGDVPTMSILFKHVRVLGVYVGSREMFENMNRAIALHRLRPVVDRVFPSTGRWMHSAT